MAITCQRCSRKIDYYAAYCNDCHRILSNKREREKREEAEKQRRKARRQESRKNSWSLAKPKKSAAKKGSWEEGIAGLIGCGVGYYAYAEGQLSGGAAFIVGIIAAAVAKYLVKWIIWGLILYLGAEYGADILSFLEASPPERIGL